MFWLRESSSPERQKPKKSVNEQLLKMDIAKEQTDLAVKNLDRAVEQVKAAADDEKDLKQTYGPVINAAEHLGDVLGKEEEKKESRETAE